MFFILNWVSKVNSRTVFESFMMNSGLIPEELSNSSAILAESGHSCGFQCHSSGFQCYSSRITEFQMESVGHCKDPWGTVKYCTTFAPHHPPVNAIVLFVLGTASSVSAHHHMTQICCPIFNLFVNLTGCKISYFI